MFGPPLPLPVPFPLPFPLPGAPSPGQAISTVGNVAQSIENAVGDAIGSVLGSFTGNPPQGRTDVAVQLPDGRGGRITFPDGVISTEQFRDFAQAVGQAFQAVRQDVQRLKSVTASVAANGSMYAPEDDNTRTGGIDPLMLMLLLKDKDNAAPAGDGLDTTTLLLLLMGNGGMTGGGNRMDTLTLLLALGKL